MSLNAASIAAYPTSQFSVYGPSGRSYTLTADGHIFAGKVESDSWGRFKGWGGAASGLACEIGISGPDGYINACNRTTSMYGVMYVQAGSYHVAVKPTGVVYVNTLFECGGYCVKGAALTGVLAGMAIEVGYHGASGFIDCYDRVAGAWGPILYPVGHLPH